MSTREAIQYLSDGGYLALFGLSLTYALRSRSQLGFDVALFFGAIASVVGLSLVGGSDGQQLPQPVIAFEGLLIMALPYLLLRLLHDLDGAAPALMKCSEAGLLISGVLLFGTGPTYPDGVVLLLVAYFVGLEGYVSVRFVIAARASRGLTRHRLFWVALGSLFVGAVILLAGVSSVFPLTESQVAGLTTGLGLASAVSYYIGFATPRLLKRGWRATDLREFVELSSGAAGVAQLLSVRDLSRALEHRVAAMVGADRAVIVLHDEASGRLTIGGEPIVMPSGRPGRFFAYRVFKEQRPRFTADAARDDPENAEVYREVGARAIFAAPITFRERRLGVLVAFGARASLFARDDLELVRVLAGQIAGFLVFRDLLARATALQAQEQANALREEFLAAAAHDLKTPLTVVLGEVQLLEREARRDPLLGGWADRLGHVNAMSLRLRRLVDDLLDASRGDQEGYLREREPVDLGSVVREAVAGVQSPRHFIEVSVAPVVVWGDAGRLAQVVTNLLENAVKYSPGGGAIDVRLEARDGEALLSVADHGIGIPDADYSTIFDRFSRGSNVDGVRAGGMGIGLYLCRRIVEEHGGQISLGSRLGEGSTFTVVLPAQALPAAAELTVPELEGSIAHAGSSAGGG